ncbi:MAG: hypothetical protein IKT67_11175 [Lachnospiraceae bacterium]|nr:hypothetical protein [Lachnospiraceae bacterium]
MNLKNVGLIGRVMPLEDTLWMALSGTGVEFFVTGTFARIAFLADDTWCGIPENRARVAVYVDEERVVDTLLDKPETVITAFKSEEPETHLVRVIKLSESAMSTCGISEIETDGEMVPAGGKSGLIEFIGDSITCGYGVDDEDRDHHFATATEDVTRAFAYKTARALEADYSMVSFSGYGIVSGYTGTGEKVGNQLVPDYYEKLGFSYGTYRDKYQPQTMVWDFSKRQPDVVVINLGTNDMSYVLDYEDRREEYVTGYVAFLKTVRKNNRTAWILCVLGMMGEALCPAVEAAVKRYKTETGDTKISYMGFSDQLPEDGYAADWHPTETTHRKAAQKLTEEIKRCMKR